MIPADAALQRLRDGNARFIAGEQDATACDHRARRAQTAREQRPVAAVLACSDSRVPVEIIFDQGIGDLFVVRIAGNVVSVSQAASIEFAASHLGARLVVVLGHTDCGAVKAVIDGAENLRDESSASLDFFIDRIRPSVERVIADCTEKSPEKIVEKVVRENIRNSVAALQNDSATIRSLVENGGLRVVGAEYSLRTGNVDFF
jgi:carbonic anhydrase